MLLTLYPNNCTVPTSSRPLLHEEDSKMIVNYTNEVKQFTFQAAG